MRIPPRGLDIALMYSGGKIVWLSLYMYTVITFYLRAHARSISGGGEREEVCIS